MGKLTENEILFLKKYAGTLTEEESDKLNSINQTDEESGQIDFSRFDSSMVASDSNWKRRSMRSGYYDRNITLKNGVGVEMSIKLDNVEHDQEYGSTISGEFVASITKNNHQDLIAEIVLELNTIVYLHPESEMIGGIGWDREVDTGYSIDGVGDIDSDNIVDVDANVVDAEVNEQNIVNFAKQLAIYYGSQPRSPYSRV